MKERYHTEADKERRSTPEYKARKLGYYYARRAKLEAAKEQALLLTAVDC